MKPKTMNIQFNSLFFFVSSELEIKLKPKKKAEEVEETKNFSDFDRS